MARERSKTGITTGCPEVDGAERFLRPLMCNAGREQGTYKAREALAEAGVERPPLESDTSVVCPIERGKGHCLGSI